MREGAGVAGLHRAKRDQSSGGDPCPLPAGAFAHKFCARATVARQLQPIQPFGAHHDHGETVTPCLALCQAGAMVAQGWRVTPTAALLGCGLLLAGIAAFLVQ